MGLQPPLQEAISCAVDSGLGQSIESTLISLNTSAVKWLRNVKQWQKQSSRSRMTSTAAGSGAAEAASEAGAEQHDQEQQGQHQEQEQRSRSSRPMAAPKTAIEAAGSA